MRKITEVKSRDRYRRLLQHNQHKVIIFDERCKTCPIIPSCEVIVRFTSDTFCFFFSFFFYHLFLYQLHRTLLRTSFKHTHPLVLLKFLLSKVKKKKKEDETKKIKDTVFLVVYESNIPLITASQINIIKYVTNCKREKKKYNSACRFSFSLYFRFVAYA